MATDKAIQQKKATSHNITLIILILAAMVFLLPIVFVVMNSFKSKLYISGAQYFSLPNAESFVGIQNYIRGINSSGLLQAFGFSLFITVCSVGLIVIFTAMTGWYITRVKSKLSGGLYYMFVFSMVVPFQMVMYAMSFIANRLHLDNPVGILIIYLGFGAGLSVFMFCGFVKAIPLEIEEAAMIDGCNTPKTFFSIVLPMLKPTAITVAILNAMWIWNDYLLPYLLMGSKYRTIPVAVQYLVGGYGSVDLGAMSAMIVLAIIPIIIFYLVCQKYIIKGVAAGAVKG